MVEIQPLYCQHLLFVAPLPTSQPSGTRTPFFPGAAQAEIRRRFRRCEERLGGGRVAGGFAPGDPRGLALRGAGPGTRRVAWGRAKIGGPSGLKTASVF